MTQTSFSPKLRVINEAAEHIGANPVDSDSEGGSGAADVLISRYDQAVAEVLELRDWHCAVRRIKPSRLPDDSALYPGYKIYQLPPDYVAMGHQEGDPYDRDRFIEDDRLYSRCDVTVLRYVSLATEESWTPSLIKLMGLTLARKCIYSRKESAAASEVLERKYMMQLRQSTAIEGQRTASFAAGSREFYSDAS